MFSIYNHDGDYKNNTQPEDESRKKKITAANILKPAVYIIAAAIIITVFIRLAGAKDPKEAGLILADGKIETAVKNLGADYVIYKIQPPNPFAVGDAVFLSDVLYLESSENLQITVRCKKNRFDGILKGLESLEGLESDAYINYAGLFKFYLKVSAKPDEADKSEETEESAEIAEIEKAENSVENLEVSRVYVFDSDKYEYIRISFDGVKINYAKSKVELFILPDYMPMSYEPDEFMVRFTVFDLIAPKSKEKIKNFGFKN